VEIERGRSEKTSDQIPNRQDSALQKIIKN